MIRQYTMIIVENFEDVGHHLIKYDHLIRLNHSLVDTDLISKPDDNDLETEAQALEDFALMLLEESVKFRRIKRGRLRKERVNEK